MSITSFFPVTIHGGDGDGSKGTMLITNFRVTILAVWQLVIIAKGPITQLWLKQTHLVTSQGI